MTTTDTSTRTEARLSLHCVRKYCDGIEEHIDAGGIAGTDNVRDLVAFVRTLDRRMSAVIEREAELRVLLYRWCQCPEVTEIATEDRDPETEAVWRDTRQALRTQEAGHE